MVSSLVSLAKGLGSIPSPLPFLFFYKIPRIA